MRLDQIAAAVSDPRDSRHPDIERRCERTVALVKKKAAWEGGLGVEALASLHGGKRFRRFSFSHSLVARMYYLW